jgi:hypothetical protein
VPRGAPRKTTAALELCVPAGVRSDVVDRRHHARAFGRESARARRAGQQRNGDAENTNEGGHSHRCAQSLESDTG